MVVGGGVSFVEGQLVIVCSCASTFCCGVLAVFPVSCCLCGSGKHQAFPQPAQEIDVRRNEFARKWICAGMERARARGAWVKEPGSRSLGQGAWVKELGSMICTGVDLRGN